MVKIAIAGGTSTFARDVIDAIVAKGKHEIIGFSRSDRFPDSTGISWMKVDYDDKAALVNALQGCEVVLCFFSASDRETVIERQKNLINAAVEAGVRRYAPSEWASRSDSGVGFYSFKDEIRAYLEQINKEKKVLEYTLFQPGLFSNYFGHPHKTTKHFDTNLMFIDFNSRRAILVGDGNYPIALTTIEDTAAVVVEALDYEGEWPVDGGFRGFVTTMSELIQLGEQIRGPFQIERVSEEDIRSGNLTSAWFPILNHPGIPAGARTEMSKSTALQFLQGTVAGGWDVSASWNSLLPEYEFISAESYLRDLWNGK